MHRFGSRSITARRRGTHVAALIVARAAAFPCALFPCALKAEIADARSAAHAGVDVFALHASPGAPTSTGWRLQLASARPYTGSGLRENALRLRLAGVRAAGSLAWEQQSSPVHGDHTLVGVVQMRQSAWHAGIGVRLRRLAFAGYAARWSSELRFGGGLRLRHGAFVVRAIPRGAGRAPARFDLGAQLSFHRDASLVVQHMREAGSAARLRGALTLRATGLALHAGYDVATGAAAGGFESGSRRVRLVYALQNHPELGWSHTWMLEFGDVSPWR
jgi:hypothetical protein